ncbi:hypothetical protein [Acinetobacter sp. NS-4]|uniref:hypothetical protein n=1 Tax=Acinetobacter sp. NS-4 TaxID=3127956 RepID=UPI00307FA9C0
MKTVIAFEIVIAILVFAIEIDARKTPGNSGWIMIFAAVFQIYFAVLLMLTRLVSWLIKKRG